MRYVLILMSGSFIFLRFFTYKVHMIIFYIFITLYEEANPSLRSEAIPMLAATSNTESPG